VSQNVALVPALEFAIGEQHMPIEIQQLGFAHVTSIGWGLDAISTVDLALKDVDCVSQMIHA